MSITITTLLFYAEQLCSFLTLSEVQGVCTYYPAILITNFYLDVQWTPFLLIKFGGNTIHMYFSIRVFKNSPNWCKLPNFGLPEPARSPKSLKRQARACSNKKSYLGTQIFRVQETNHNTNLQPQLNRQYKMKVFTIYDTRQVGEKMVIKS